MSQEQIWAPWRLSYITQPKESHEQGCFICRYLEQPGCDAEHYVLSRGQHTVTLLNRYPYNNGHLLVAPLSHKGALSELTDEELLECQQSLQTMTVLISRLMSAEGFNIGLNLGRVAGAGLPGHLHWHLVPRWTGDTNFMPVLADVSVLPQSLTTLYAWLKEHLD